MPALQFRFRGLAQVLVLADRVCITEEYDEVPREVIRQDTFGNAGSVKTVWIVDAVIRHRVPARICSDRPLYPCFRHVIKEAVQELGSR